MNQFTLTCPDCHEKMPYTFCYRCQKWHEEHVNLTEPMKRMNHHNQKTSLRGFMTHKIKRKKKARMEAKLKLFDEKDRVLRKALELKIERLDDLIRNMKEIRDSIPIGTLWTGMNQFTLTCPDCHEKMPYTFCYRCQKWHDELEPPRFCTLCNETIENIDEHYRRVHVGTYSPDCYYEMYTKEI